MNSALQVRPLADGRPGIAVSGEIDMATAEQFRAAVVTAVADDRVVVDLTAVTYVGSAGLSVLFALAKVARLELVVNEILAPMCAVAGLERVARVATA